MAVLLIRMAGDPVLRQKAKRVRTIDASIQKLIDDMIDTMRDAPGVGLAANQVGVPLRVIVIEVPEEDGEDPPPGEPPRRQLYTLINPQIVKRSGQRQPDEGCLSIPGYKAPTPRSVSVTAKGLNRDGKEIRIKAENNLLAEALEHEIDHINGILYIDHLESMDQLVKIEDENEPEDEVKASARGGHGP
ncbi:MAG: peptide deformylase [Chloroflexi bacterium RBG_16_68_14]|nr:MAG: peptide deformylase [Chloroflexi bacterium RBG_16_68_14]